MELSFVLNGSPVTADVPPATRLLDLLRDTFHLTGTKEACGQGECGACTVLLDDQAVNACLVLAQQVDGHAVMTIEGLAKDGILVPYSKPSSIVARSNAAFARLGCCSRQRDCCFATHIRLPHRSRKRWKGISAAAPAMSKSLPPCSRPQGRDRYD